MRRCSVQGCERVHYGRGFCQLHYSRWRAHGDPLVVLQSRRPRTPVGERLAARTERTADGCWVHRAHQNRSGHTFTWRDGEKVLAHRVAWELEYGPIPDGLCVLHHCDNPPCVRPDHLFLGTQADNNADRDAKGRHRPLPGSQNGVAKLAEDDVRAIRRRRRAGEPQHRIAESFGVCQQTISRIDRGLGWRHVEEADV